MPGFAVATVPVLDLEGRTFWILALVMHECVLTWVGLGIALYLAT
jgi:hypothetical protein